MQEKNILNQKKHLELQNALNLWPTLYSTDEIICFINQLEDPFELQKISEYIDSGYFYNPNKFVKIDVLKKISHYIQNKFPLFAGINTLEDDYLKKIKSMLNTEEFRNFESFLNTQETEDSIVIVQYSKDFGKINQALTARLRELSPQLPPQIVNFTMKWPSFMHFLLVFHWVATCYAKSNENANATITADSNNLLPFNETNSHINNPHQLQEFKDQHDETLLALTAETVSERNDKINLKDMKQDTILALLHNAIINNDNTVITWVIESGYDLNHFSVALKLDLPLVVACQQGQLEIVKILLNSGANIHARSLSGKSFITETIAAKQIIILQYLLERGVDFFVHDNGRLPFLYALEMNDFDSAKLIYEHGVKDEFNFDLFNLMKKIVDEVAASQKNRKQISLIDLDRINELRKFPLPENIYGKDLYGMILMHTGHIHYFLKEYEPAILSAEESLNHLVPHAFYHQAYGEIILESIIHADRHTKNHLIDRSLQILYPTNFPESDRLCSIILGIMSFSENKQTLQKGFSLARKLINEKRFSFEAYVILGNHYLNLRNYELSLKNYQEAYSIRSDEEGLLAKITTLRYLRAEKTSAIHLLKRDNLNSIDRPTPYPLLQNLFCETTKDINTDRILLQNPAWVNFDSQLVNKKFELAVEGYLYGIHIKLLGSTKHEYFKKSIMILKEILSEIPLNDPYFNPVLAVVYGTLGLSLAEEDNLDESIKYLRLSITLALDLSHHIRVLQMYTKIEVQLGNISNAKKALLILNTYSQHNPELQEIYAQLNQVIDNHLDSIEQPKELSSKSDVIEPTTNSLNGYFYALLSLLSLSGILVLLKLFFTKKVKKEEISPEKIGVASIKQLIGEFYSFSLDDSKKLFTLVPQLDIPVLLPETLRTTEIKTITLNKKILLKESVTLINDLFGKDTAQASNNKISLKIPATTINERQTITKRLELWQTLLKDSVEHQLLICNRKLSLLENKILIQQKIENEIRTHIDKKIAEMTSYLSELIHILSMASPSEKRFNSYHKLNNFLTKLDEKTKALNDLTPNVIQNNQPNKQNLTDIQNKLILLKSNLDDENSIKQAFEQIEIMNEQFFSIYKEQASDKLTLNKMDQEIEHLSKRLKNARNNFEKDRLDNIKIKNSLFNFIFDKATSKIDEGKTKKQEELQAEEAKKKRKEEKEVNLQKFKKIREESKKKKQTSEKRKKMIFAEKKPLFFVQPAHAEQNKPVQNKSVQILQIAIDHFDFMSEILSNSKDSASSNEVASIITSEGLQECLFKIAKSLNLGLLHFQALARLVNDKCAYSRVANIILHDNHRIKTDQKMLELFSSQMLKYFSDTLREIKKNNFCRQQNKPLDLLNSFEQVLIPPDSNSIVFQYEKQCKQGILIQLELIKLYYKFYKEGEVNLDRLNEMLDSSLFLIRCKSRSNIETDRILKRYNLIDDFLHFRKGQLKLTDVDSILQLIKDLTVALSAYQIKSGTHFEKSLISILSLEKIDKRSLTYSLQQLSEPSSFIRIEKQYTKFCLEEMMKNLRKLSLLSDHIIAKNKEKGYHTYSNDGPLQCAMKMIIAKIGQLHKNLPLAVDKELTEKTPKDLLLTKQQRSITRFVDYRDRLSHNFEDEVDDKAYYFLFEDISPEQLLLVCRQSNGYLNIIRKYYESHQWLEQHVGHEEKEASVNNVTPADLSQTKTFAKP